MEEAKLLFYLARAREDQMVLCLFQDHLTETQTALCGFELISLSPYHKMKTVTLPFIRFVFNAKKSQNEIIGIYRIFVCKEIKCCLKKVTRLPMY